MIKRLFSFFCLLSSFSVYAQDIKTGVLVIGANANGYAAAIQSAKSGVKTLLIDTGNFQSITLSPEDRAINAGIYSGFGTIVDSLQKAPLQAHHSLTPTFTAQIFKTWTDTLKNLTVLRNVSILKIKKSGKHWQVGLSDREIKADILLDARPDYAIAKLAGLEIKVDAQRTESIYADKLYRTSVAALKKRNGTSHLVPLSSLLVPNIENLVLAGPLGKNPTLLSAQAAGAIAAYCVFFKTNSKKVNVRAIQGELLSYKSHIIEYADIADTDSSMIAFQHIGVTGILKAKEEKGYLFFLPDSLVSVNELRQPFRELYSRSQIWFLDHNEAILTLETALSLIKFVGSRGKELDKELESAWKKSLKLSGEFDLRKRITRREFAIILDTYLQPFNVATGIDGTIKN